VEWGPEMDRIYSSLGHFRVGASRRPFSRPWAPQTMPGLCGRVLTQASDAWSCAMGYEDVVGLTYLGLGSRGKEGRSHGKEESGGGNLGHCRDSAVQRR
jgi:hypothetical protein